MRLMPLFTFPLALFAAAGATPGYGQDATAVQGTAVQGKSGITLPAAIAAGVTAQNTCNTNYNNCMAQVPYNCYSQCNPS